MKAEAVDRWIWILIYGGLFLGGLGIAVARTGEPFGWLLAGFGAAAVAVGVVLIFVRARMR